MQPQSLTARPWTMVVGRQLSYLEGNFSGAMLNFRGVYTYIYISQSNKYEHCLKHLIKSSIILYFTQPQNKSGRTKKSDYVYQQNTHILVSHQDVDIVVNPAPVWLLFFNWNNFMRKTQFTTRMSLPGRRWSDHWLASPRSIPLSYLFISGLFHPAPHHRS